MTSSRQQRPRIPATKLAHLKKKLLKMATDTQKKMVSRIHVARRGYQQRHS